MRLEVIPTGTTTATVILDQEQVDLVRGAPGRSRVPLAIAFEGRIFRTSISVYRGQWMMVVNKEMRDGGLVPGHTYDVDISMDTEERVVDVPPDLARAISDAGLSDRWDSLSYTARKEHVRKVTEAKKPETRDRRVAAVIEGLS